MPTFSKAQRLKIALGGFVSFTGFMMLLLAMLTATETGNPSSVFQNELVIAAVVAVGILDVVCGFLLYLKDREISFSFTSHKKKPHNDVDYARENP